MFKRIFRVMVAFVGSVVLPSSAVAAEDPYRFLTGNLNGQLTMAIVDSYGTAVVVELQEDRGKIIRGLAAGAIVSDLSEVASSRMEAGYSVSSGAAASEVRINGKLLVGRASPQETIAAINALTQLTDAQKNELIALLALQ